MYNLIQHVGGGVVGGGDLGSDSRNFSELKVHLSSS